MTKIYNAHKDSSGNYQTLEEHLIETAQLAEMFADKLGLKSFGYGVGLYHDLGKACKEFQARLEGEERCDHSSFGGQELGKLCENKSIQELASLLIFSHHGGLMDVFSSNLQSTLLNRINKPLDIKYESNLEKIFSELIPYVDTKKMQEEFKELIPKLKAYARGKVLQVSNLKTAMPIINQEVDSSLKLEESEALNFTLTLVVKFLFSCLVDADRLSTIKFEVDKKSEIKQFALSPKVAWEEILRAVDKKVESFPKNRLSEIRSEIYNRAKETGRNSENAIYKMPCQTGGGKTIASLAFALEAAIKNKKDRIIIVLPYLSIIEQNAKVIEDILSEGGLDKSLLLKCYSSFVYDQNDDEKNYYFTDNFGGQIVITTMVQFLESVYSGGASSIRRFHNYQNSVIIFDEVQAMPVSVVGFSLRLFDFLTDFLKSTLILCSATQPIFDNVKRLETFAISTKSSSFKMYEGLERATIIDTCTMQDKIEEERCNVKFPKFDFYQSVFTEMETNNSILIIGNSKSKVREIFDKLQKTTNYSIFYLSTNLCGEHRIKKIELIKDALNKKEKIIVVSTQLIEAGVDLDFNVVYRGIAGLDSILQSAGRCNREGKMRNENGEYIKGKTYIVKLEGEKVLDEIKECQTAAIRLLRENFVANVKNCYGGIDKLSTIEDVEWDKLFTVRCEKLMEVYYNYYIYEKIEKNEHKFLIKNRNGLSLNLYSLYSRNEANIENNAGKIKMLRQAFKTAGDNFSLINNNTVSVLMPYGNGIKMIESLRQERFNADLKYAGKYCVNVYANKLEKEYCGLIKKSKFGIYYLDADAYSEDLGLNISEIQTIF